MDSIQHIMPEPISFENPYKDYRKIRKKRAILRVSPMKWLLTGYNASFAALCSQNVSHWQDEDNNKYEGQLKSSVVDIARLFTPESNTQFRDIIIHSLSLKMLIYNEADLKDKARKLLENTVSKTSFDFIAEFADPFTFNIICEIIGFTQDDSDTLYEIIKAQEQKYLQYLLYNSHKNVFDEGERYKELLLFMEGFVEKRYRDTNFQDDLISKLIHEAAANTGIEKVDVRYLCSIVLFLIYTGHHNMTNFLGNIMIYLSKNKATLNLLRSNPALIDKSINEFLRLEAPVQFLIVHAKRDFLLEETEIKSGSELLVCIGSSNRDESVFEAPDEFRLDREMSRHLSFGYGAYRCIGSKLATMEIVAALKTFLEMFPNIEVERNGLTWKTDNIVERGPKKLILKLV